MLLIQQVSEKFIKCDYVRCPSCKTGRLCDKTLGIQIRAVPITDSLFNKSGPGLITECIRVMGDKSIIITLKGGFELREKI